MKRALWIFLMLTLWAFSACSVHQRTAPEALMTLSSDLGEGGAADVRPAVDWWLSFEDEALNTRVAQALKENPTLDGAAAQVRKAEAFLAGQKAADLPGVTLSGNLGRARTEGVMGGVSSTWNLSAAASYELDLWGRRAALTTQRVLDRDASLAALSSAMVSVSAQVADTWYLRVERSAQLSLAEARVALRRERLELVERRYGQGTVPAREVYGARAELAAEEAFLSGYRSDLAVAEHALSALLNRKPGTTEEPLPGGAPGALPDLSPLADRPLSSRLILGRPDMIQAMIQVEKADEAVAVSLADRFPSFSLTAGYGRSGYEVGPLSGSGPVWNVGGNLLAPLFDWGGRRAMVKADRAAFDETLALYRSTALAAFKEAADALSFCRNGDMAMARLQDAFDAASSTTAYIKSRYLEGASDYLTLLAARISENEARGRLIAQQRLLLSHRIGLARALGGSFSDQWLQSYVKTD
ncbi:efflux transporter outer membrane subunit [Desulfoluna sp.]|uniref:efflux transporter outer membrane subunit n=1 Tax=Desulfoluna sp. TaxID=2045199 RepID=UPI00261083C6|nr:efflux transporter outer membrane subunit [Desulfoluna sp.]